MSEKFKLATTYSPLETLTNMKGGTTVLIPTAKIRTVSLRSAATTLKRKGYIFHVTVKGLINETSVTCIKSPKR